LIAAQVASPILEKLEAAAAKISAGDLPQAEAGLEEVLKASPGNYQALNLLGVIRAQQHRDAEAEKLFQEVIQQKPVFIGARVNLGLLYAQDDRDEDAVKPSGQLERTWHASWGQRCQVYRLRFAPQTTSPSTHVEGTHHPAGGVAWRRRRGAGAAGSRSRAGIPADHGSTSVEARK